MRSSSTGAWAKDQRNHHSSVPKGATVSTSLHLAGISSTSGLRSVVRVEAASSVSTTITSRSECSVA